jgi:hypothetical protein
MRILIVGSGSLARGICYSLAIGARHRMDVTVLARSSARVSEICWIANVRATVTGTPVRFESAAAPEMTQPAIAEVLSAHRPSVVVNCASLQSPWEGTRSPSSWTALLRTAGFGAALPLQAMPAATIARAVAGTSQPAAFVNACYPDAVNAVLRALGLPVLCGIGNIAVIAAALRTALGDGGQHDLRVLAHHAQLHEPPDAEGEVLAWVHGERVPGVTAKLTSLRRTAREELNAVTGLTAADVLSRLAAGGAVRTHLPGPLGLPGGYPVRVADGRIDLDLPDGMTAGQAIEWNQQMAERDGVVVGADGQVRFSQRTWCELDRYLPDLARGFAVSEIDQARERMLELRQKLRAQGAGS